MGLFKRITCTNPLIQGAQPKLFQNLFLQILLLFENSFSFFFFFRFFRWGSVRIRFHVFSNRDNISDCLIYFELRILRDCMLRIPRSSIKRLQVVVFSISFSFSFSFFMMKGAQTKLFQNLLFRFYCCLKFGQLSAVKPGLSCITIQCEANQNEMDQNCGFLV